jgi:hypothetical protein
LSLTARGRGRKEAVMGCETEGLRAPCADSATDCQKGGGR